MTLKNTKNFDRIGKNFAVPSTPNEVSDKVTSIHVTSFS